MASLFRCVVVLTIAIGLGACVRSTPVDTTSVAGPAAGPASSTPPPGTFDARELSTTVRPQDNFWKYVNARWIDATEIPADRSSYGSFHHVLDRTDERIRTLLDRSLEAGDDASHAARTIGHLYGSFLDEATVEELGLEPLAGYIQRIDALSGVQAVPALMGELAQFGVTGPVSFYTDNDAFDGTRLLLYLWQGGLGMPNRDYYLSDNDKLVNARQAYREYIAAMFELAGWDNGASGADAVLALETAMAERHWTPVRNRDRQTIYSNQLSLAEAEALTGEFALTAWLSSLGAGAPGKVVVAQTSYFEALGALLVDTDLAVWQAYMKFHLLHAMAPYLPQAFVERRFDFTGRTLRGQEEPLPRWRRGVRLVNGSAGQLLGQLYVAEYFPESAKQEIAALVENLRVAYGESIRALAWMSDATKAQALIKLDGFLPKLGYPETWRDFAGLTVARNTLAENVLAAASFNTTYRLGLLNEPVDRTLWSTNPQTVNAFYRPTHNSITFPAGILQPPFFDPAQDPALNYGAIGSIIGHEFSHGFDDQGRKFDATGLLRNWWTDEDAAQYEARSELIVGQYSVFQPLADTAINGRLTLGENIGDLAGVIMSFKAFELSGYADGPSVGGLTPRQRFFVGYALAFRSKIREQYLRELLLRDTHSPAEFRVTGVLRNVPAFYEAYGVEEGDGMYLPPARRAKIW